MVQEPVTATIVAVGQSVSTVCVCVSVCWSALYKYNHFTFSQGYHLPWYALKKYWKALQLSWKNILD